MENRDPTFRNYQADAAAAYAAYRSPYPDKLIEMIVEAHVSSGGQKDMLLDVGCGPGIATRQISPFFQHVIGADPGQSMVETARHIPSKSASGEPVRFEVCAAEELDSIAQPGSIDLITAATSAHWFHMPKFYVSAAKVLKPGGSIIIFSGGSTHCDQETTPNAVEVQEKWTELEREVLAPFELPGNKLARELYANLEMPWTIRTSDPEMKAALAQFDEAASSRNVFNENGARDDRFENGYLQRHSVSLDIIRKMLGTVSQVTRWRDAHKEQLEKGEIEDCVEYMLRVTKETMEKGLPEGQSLEVIDSIMTVVMIVIKKKAAN